MIGIYARSSHIRDTDWNGHGYSVIAVRLHTVEQAEQVQSFLQSYGLPEPYNHPYKWYGGTGWDYLFTIAGSDAARVVRMRGGHMDVRDIKHPDANLAEWGISMGDARYIGLYDANDLLASSKLSEAE